METQHHTRAVKGTRNDFRIWQMYMSGCFRNPWRRANLLVLYIHCAKDADICLLQNKSWYAVIVKIYHEFMWHKTAWVWIELSEAGSWCLMNIIWQVFNYFFHHWFAGYFDDSVSSSIIVSRQWVLELAPKLFVNWCESTRIYRSHLKMCSSSKDSLSILTKSCVR